MDLNRLEEVVEAELRVHWQVSKSPPSLQQYISTRPLHGCTSSPDASNTRSSDWTTVAEVTPLPVEAMPLPEVEVTVPLVEEMLLPEVIATPLPVEVEVPVEETTEALPVEPEIDAIDPQSPPVELALAVPSPLTEVWTNDWPPVQPDEAEADVPNKRFRPRPTLASVAKTIKDKQTTATSLATALGDCIVIVFWIRGFTTLNLLKMMSA